MSEDVSVNTLEDDGIRFESRLMGMVARFANAEKGVDGNDAMAALLLEASRDSRLDDLLARRIHVANSVIDELTDVEDLRFRKGEK